MTISTDNALHAAATWLERNGAAPTAIAVVGIKPASIGAWEPGTASVRLMARIDDAGAELCEAVGPAVNEALEHLDDDQRVAVVEAIGHGARLQALLSPAAEEIAVRLVHGGRPIEIATLTRSELAH